MTDQPRVYFSYLLRVWRARQGNQVAWRASLECPMTGERRAFASLEECWAFVHSQAAVAEDRANARGGQE